MRFYATEIILGLEHMHHRFVVYRDLKVSCAAGSPVTGSAREACGPGAQTFPVVFLTRPRHPCDVGLFQAPDSVLGARVCPSSQSPRCLLQCLAQLRRSFQNFNWLIRAKRVGALFWCRCSFVPLIVIRSMLTKPLPWPWLRVRAGDVLREQAKDLRLTGRTRVNQDIDWPVRVHGGARLASLQSFPQRAVPELHISRSP